MGSTATRIFNLISVLLACFSGKASARWAKFEEARRIYQIDSETITLKKDGTYVNEYRRAFLVNTEAARADLDVLEIKYDGALGTTEVLDVHVVNGNERVPVPKHLISDRADNSEELGLTGSRSIKIALPNINVGSVVDYRVRQVRLQPQIKGLYNGSFHLGKFATHKGANVRISSEMPLQYRVYGPKDALRVSRTRTSGTYIYEFTLLKDSYYRTTNESEHDNWSAEPIYPLIQVTSLRSWSELVSFLENPIEEKLNGKLPSRYESILANARAKKSFSERMDTLTIGLNKELRYLGDWRSSADYYIPRSLEDTAEHGFGDCKDFSLTLVKLARELGYSAHLALVHRGEPDFDPTSLPMLSHFNHMITRIEDENGNVHWIDPTNSLSNATHVGSDIAGRDALVVSRRTNRLEAIPAEKPEHNKVSIEAVIDYKPNKRQTIEFSFSMQGEFAKDFIQRMARIPENRKRDHILEIFAVNRPLVRGDYTLEPIPAHVLKPVNIKSTVELSAVPLETTTGYGMPLSADFRSHLNFAVDDMIQGVKIGEVGTHVYRSIYRNAVLVGRLPENCTVDSKWISAARTFVTTENRISVETVLVTKTPYISNQELKSNAFVQLREQLTECVSEKILIYKTAGE